MLFPFGENAISFQLNSDSAKKVWMSVKERKTKHDGEFLSKAAKAEILLSENRSVNNKKTHEYI